MSDLFQILTTSCVEGEPVDFDYLVPGHVKQLSHNTVLYLGADRISEDGNDHYEPVISIFSRGLQVEPKGDGFCFDLSMQIGFIICVRGMRVDADGQPVRFLVEFYKRQRQQHRLRVVS